MPAPLDQLRARLLPRYEVLNWIGEGGMAAVYRALQVDSDRIVAVKIFRRELGSAVARSRFIREIEIASALDHPHIVPTIDSGGDGELLYLVMPFIEGPSLQDRLAREHQLPVDEALDITLQVAEALDYAHRKGFIHRDVKPANILLSPTGAMIADFGVARALEASAGKALTSTGIAVGTPHYMSPEQAGAAPDVDARSDQYSLACVLFEMLVGDPPFSGHSAQAIAARHLTETPRPIEVVRPQVSPGTLHAVYRALSKVPADRFASTADFARAALQPEAPQRAPPVAERAATGVRARPRRRLAAVVLTGAAAISALAYAVGPWAGEGAGAALDPDRIVVFPPANIESVDPGSGVEETIATIVGYALEGSEPLKWLDGWDWVPPEVRDDPHRLTADDKSRITRDLGARHYIDGSIVRLADSVTVILRLFDTGGDGSELLARHGAAGHADSASYGHLGLAAVKGLLGPLLRGGAVDVSALEERSPVAVANWLQGERAYRRSDFESALDLYARAVRQDSALALAALGGALAADWHQSADLAAPFVETALRSVALLPPRHREFVLGLRDYFDGRADSAVAHFRAAAVPAPDWTEAQIALGEVHHHYLPDAQPLDSVAHAHFSRALALDGSYTPPRFHLAELDLRRGDVDAARRHLRALESGAVDASLPGQIRLMLACADGREVDWEAAVRANVQTALSAAKSLSVGGAYPDCALEGFTQVLTVGKEVSRAHRWGALLGAHGLLVATGRWADAQAILADPAAGDLPTGHLVLIAAAAGAPFAAHADAVVDSLGQEYENQSAAALWSIGAWMARTGRIEPLREITLELETRAAAEDAGRATRLQSRILQAHLAVLEAWPGAMEQLRDLRPTGRQNDLTWQPWEGLAQEKMLLARHQLQDGRAADALRTASLFDAQEPVSYLNYLHESLLIRRDAAASLGDRGAEERFRRRLTALRPSDVSPQRGEEQR